jgi:hypothetical protein
MFSVTKSVVERVAMNKNFQVFLNDLMVSVYSTETMETRSKTVPPDKYRGHITAKNAF